MIDIQVEKDLNLYFGAVALNIDNTQIPPSVFLLYNLSLKNECCDLQSFTISAEEREYLKTLLPSASTFNGENMMRYIFWKSHRAKVRNKKRATSWKFYNLK